MKSRQVTVMVLVMLFGSSSFAAERSTRKEETKGVVTGVVIGSVLGGPVGAGFGAILGGGVIGKLVGVGRVNRELASEMRSQEHSYQQDRAEMQTAVTNLEVELDRMIKIQNRTWDRIEMPVQFRTNSSEIETLYETSLSKVALSLSQNRSTQVILSGFADRRGTVDENQILSAKRVASVKAYLIAQDVQEQQIVENAFGETRPLLAEETEENDFFDRRVELAFSTDIESQVATR